MAKTKIAVSDAGPFIHLQEIGWLKSLKVLKETLTTQEILDECKRIKDILNKAPYIKQKNLSAEGKNLAEYITHRFNLDLGESTGIALCKQERIRLFLTDDLEARQVSATLGFEPHGTIAVILRALKHRMLTKKEAKEAIRKLHEESSLFLTKDLTDWTAREIDNFKA